MSSRIPPRRHRACCAPTASLLAVGHGVRDHGHRGVSPRPRARRVRRCRSPSPRLGGVGTGGTEGARPVGPTGTSGGTVGRHHRRHRADGGGSGCRPVPAGRTQADPRRSVLASLLRLQRLQRRRHPQGRHRWTRSPSPSAGSKVPRPPSCSPASPARRSTTPRSRTRTPSTHLRSTSPPGSSSTAGKLKIVYFMGAGSGASELLGGGKETALADATKTAEGDRRASPTSAASPSPTPMRLARQGVVNFGRALPVGQVVHRLAGPTRGASSPTAPTSSSHRGAAGDRRARAGRRWPSSAAPSVSGKPRKFAIVAPENAEYQESVNSYIDAHGQRRPHRGAQHEVQARPHHDAQPGVEHHRPAQGRRGHLASSAAATR